MRPPICGANTSAVVFKLMLDTVNISYCLFFYQNIALYCTSAVIFLNMHIYIIVAFSVTK